MVDWFVVKMEHSPHYARGWGNGYIVVDRSHPTFGKDYDEVENTYGDIIRAHGGLTFAGNVNDLRALESDKYNDKEYWVFGFDTAHYGDTMDRWDQSTVEIETKKLAERFRSLFKKKLTIKFKLPRNGKEDGDG